MLRRSREAWRFGLLSDPRAIEFPTEGGLTAHGYSTRRGTGLHRAGERKAAADRHEPRRANRVELRIAQVFNPILDQPRHRRARRKLRRQHRLRPRLSRTAQRQLGHRRCRRLRQRRALSCRRGQVDGNRLAIRGGSAGGYTTLCALTFRDVFKAGASHYGISDLRRSPGTPTSSSRAISMD